MGQPWPLLSFIFGPIQANIITIFTTNICEKMSILCTCLGFEPTTLGHEFPPNPQDQGSLP